jgi:hypothetical protein
VLATKDKPEDVRLVAVFDHGQKDAWYLFSGSPLYRRGDDGHGRLAAGGAASPSRWPGCARSAREASTAWRGPPALFRSGHKRLETHAVD